MHSSHRLVKVSSSPLRSACVARHARVEQLLFPQESDAAAAKVLDENLGQLLDMLGARTIASIRQRCLGLGSVRQSPFAFRRPPLTPRS